MIYFSRKGSFHNAIFFCCVNFRNSLRLNKILENYSLNFKSIRKKRLSINLSLFYVLKELLRDFDLKNFMVSWSWEKCQWSSGLFTHNVGNIICLYFVYLNPFKIVSAHTTLSHRLKILSLYNIVFPLKAKISFSHAVLPSDSHSDF